jgi:ABC-type antimicrobial peptide transport system permease subunit
MSEPGRQVNNLPSLVIRLLRELMPWLRNRLIGMSFGIGFGAFVGIVGAILYAIPATSELDIINFAAFIALVFGAIGLALGFKNMKEFVKWIPWLG